MADRTSKRNDDWEPATGVASDANGPADLRGATLRFLAKATVGATTIIIDGAGNTINVEDETDDVADRGKYRFEQLPLDVSQAGDYTCELEVTMPNGKKVTFPNTTQANPTWRIDEDIA